MQTCSTIPISRCIKHLTVHPAVPYQYLESTAVQNQYLGNKKHIQKYHTFNSTIQTCSTMPISRKYKTFNSTIQTCSTIPISKEYKTFSSTTNTYHTILISMKYKTYNN